MVARAGTGIEMLSANESDLLMEQNAQDAWEVRLEQAKAMAPVERFDAEARHYMMIEAQGGIADLELLERVLLDENARTAMLRFFCYHCFPEWKLPGYEGRGDEQDLQLGRRVANELAAEYTEQKALEWARRMT